MWRAALLLAGAAAGPCAAAGSTADPLAAPACTAALAQLHQAETRALAARSPAAVRGVQVQQRQAALDCRLDTPAPAPRPTVRLHEPVRVSPVAPGARPLSAPGAAVPGAAPAAIPTSSAAVTLTACDDHGCWTSDGRRLPRAGPAGSMLIGPTGLCTPRGSTLSCP